MPPPPFVGFSATHTCSDNCSGLVLFLSIHFCLQELSKITCWGPWTNSKVNLCDICSMVFSPAGGNSIFEIEAVCRFCLFPTTALMVGSRFHSLSSLPSSHLLLTDCTTNDYTPNDYTPTDYTPNDSTPNACPPTRIHANRRINISISPPIGGSASGR